mgnify:CR=1 FL=1
MKRLLLIPLLFICSLLFSAPPFFLKASANDSTGYIVKVGDRCPDFKLTLANGKTSSLKELKGKVVMLQFTASWCGVCRLEMPFIEKEIWQVYKDKGLVLIGVDRDEPVEKLTKFSEDMKITYPLALDPGAAIFALFAEKQSGVTRNVVIDPNGKIVFLSRLFYRADFDAMKEKIRTLLEEKAIEKK